METRRQALDRAAKLLKEFSLPESVLRLLDPNERPLGHRNHNEYSDGRYYGNNESYYRATYCVHTSQGFEQVVLSVEVSAKFQRRRITGNVDASHRPDKGIGSIEGSPHQ